MNRMHAAKRLFAASAFLLWLGACAALPPPAPLELGQNEVPIDKSFHVSLISVPKTQISMLFFLSTGQTRNFNYICTAFYYKPVDLVSSIDEVDLVGSNRGLRFNDRNSIIAIAMAGEKFDFVHPDHKAKCLTFSLMVSMQITQPKLRIYSLTDTKPVMANIGPTMQTSSLNSISMN